MRLGGGAVWSKNAPLPVVQVDEFSRLDDLC